MRPSSTPSAPISSTAASSAPASASMPMPTASTRPISRARTGPSSRATTMQTATRCYPMLPTGRCTVATNWVGGSDHPLPGLGGARHEHAQLRQAVSGRGYLLQGDSTRYVEALRDGFDRYPNFSFFYPRLIATTSATATTTRRWWWQTGRWRPTPRVCSSG